MVICVIKDGWSGSGSSSRRRRRETDGSL